MRLDVELFPLLSKELVVKNVLVKSAVINITDDSKGNVAKENKSTSTVNQTQIDQPKNDTTKPSKWSFTLDKLDIVDSTVVYQQDKDLISFRETNISVAQKDTKSVAIDLSGVVNRDQQDLIYALNADVNLANFPKSAQVNLNKLTYNYKGVGVPAGQLKGEIKATINYQQSPLVLDSKDFNLVLNDNQFKGELKIKLDKIPYFEALLASENLDLSPFMFSDSTSQSAVVTGKTQSQPVVVQKTASGNELAFLKQFNAKLNLTVNQITADKLIINNMIVDANNQNGVATLNKVDFDLANGHIKIDGNANGNQPKALLKLAAKVSDIDLSMLFEQLALANNFAGKFSAQGNFSSNTIVPEKMISALEGNLSVKAANVKFNNLNIQRVIQNSVSQYSKAPVTDDQYQKFTQLTEVSADAALANGNLSLSSVKALSATLDVNGNGRVGLSKQDLDIDLAVKILSGWNGDSQTISKLQNIAIPVRIYGAFDQLHYNVDANKIIKDVLNDKLQSQLGKLKERLGNTQKSSSDDSEKQSETQNDQDDKAKAKALLDNLINQVK